VPNDFTFVAAGGADSIGQSCYVFNAGPTTIAVDYGGSVGARLLGPQRLGRRIDHILVTHAHGDHVWGLPWALDDNPHVRMHATPETLELAGYNLRDAIQVATAERRPVPYSERQVRRVCQRMHNNPILPGERRQLGPGLYATAVGAGHILGAVSYLIEYGDRKAFVTGDICLRSRGLIGPAQVPKLEHCDMLVRESTYAGVASEMTFDEAEGALTDAAVQTVQGGGRVLIPVFAIDRELQVALRLRADKRLAKVPIFVAGGEQPTNIYLRRFGMNTDLDGVERLINPESPRYRHLMSAREAMIIVATSGMVNLGTPSYAWAKRLLEEPKSAILFTSYQSPMSTGGRILQLRGRPGAMLGFPDGSRYKFRCRVEQFDLSAHMKEDEALELEAALNPAQVVHVHGDHERIVSYIVGRRGQGPARHMSKVGSVFEI
jgi:Cft2 family RNA processing exonuclease